LYIHLRVAHWILCLGIASRVNGHNYSLRPKAAPDGLNQRWVSQRCGVHADLVGASFKHLRRIVRRADATSNREGDEQLARCAANRIKHRLPALVGGGNVQQNNLVGAFARVACCKRRWVTGVDQVNKLRAFDHAPAMHVKAGDDALG
jgi:hypothetical protein